MPGRILVGVDGSAGSRRALRWAVEEAAAHRSIVDAVMAWQSPYDFAGGLYYVRGDEREIAEGAMQRLAEVVAEVGSDHPEVEIHPVALEGDPAELLCAWSDEADLLVVGSRGLGRFARLALGSVSTKCAHHSHCPVVIVPRIGPGPHGPESRTEPTGPYGNADPLGEARHGSPR